MAFTKQILEIYLAVIILILTIAAFIFLMGINASNSEITITNLLLLIIAGILVLNTHLMLRIMEGENNE